MKLQKIIFLLHFLAYSIVGISQNIEVCDNTIKLNALKEESLYFAFAAGDEIIFEIKELDNKDISEIRIMEYPDVERFSAIKTSNIENKIIRVQKNVILVFELKNSTIQNRTCKIKILRKPAQPSTKNFNTTISWTKELIPIDPNQIMGYDTIYTDKIKKEILKKDSKEEIILDKQVRVSPKTSFSSNRTALEIELPSDEVLPLKETKMSALIYWIAVGEEGNQAWKDNVRLVSQMVKGVSSFYISPLGAYAAGAVTELMIPKKGDAIYMAISDEKNKDLFLKSETYKVLDQSTGIASYRKIVDKTQIKNNFWILLRNDNLISSIDTNIKISVILETTIYVEKKYREMTINPRYHPKNVREVKVPRINP